MTGRWYLPLLLLLTLSGCATTATVLVSRPVISIEEICPDDETCTPATPDELREFFRRYAE